MVGRCSDDRSFHNVDGCERWVSLIEAPTEYYRVPISYPTPINPGTAPVMPRSSSWSYRLYKRDSVEFGRGLAHYVEVAQ